MPSKAQNPRPRHYHRTHPRHDGVYQRCIDGVCPPVARDQDGKITDPGRCRAHTWSYRFETVEAGKRQTHSEGGYPTAAEAAQARADAIHRNRRGEPATKADAERAEREAARVAAEAQAQQRALGLTFEAWLGQHLERRVRLGKIRPNTARSYREAAALHLLPRLGATPIADIRGTDLTDLYLDLLERLAPATVHRVHAIASGCLKAAAKDKRIPANPAEDAEVPELTPVEQTAAWEPDQLGRWLDAIEQHPLYPLYLAAAHTGMRRSELLGLEWEHVLFDDRVLHVRQTRVIVNGHTDVRIVRGGKSKRARRDISIDATTAGTLRAWRRRQAELRLATGPAWAAGDLVFTDGVAGVHPETMTKTFPRLVRLVPDLRQDVHLHSLRHTHVRALIAAGYSIAQIAYRLGHSVQVCERVYGALFPSVAAEMAERAEAMIPRQRAS